MIEGRKNPLPLPSCERLHALLDYDPATGILRRLANAARMKAGDIAGGPTSAGYWRVSLDGKRYKAHRLIWKMMTGLDPDLEPEHRDGNGMNNSWSNLRPATKSQNMMNTSIRSDNTSGIKGVSLHKKTGRWDARIQAGGVKYFLGMFDTAEQAMVAYQEASRRLHGEFARAA